jgi:hypothetical protein
MREKIVLIFLMAFSICHSQDTFGNYKEELSNNLILNFISPGLDYELVIGNKSIISTGLGIGYSGAYDKITAIENNGFNYAIAPFTDIQYKLIYNREKRAKKKRSNIYNSGNFISLRLLGKGPSIAENLTRTDDIDFAFGPTWGLQRTKNNLRYLFDIGPQYYFDTKGNSGFFPIMIQVNIGINLSK